MVTKRGRVVEGEILRSGGGLDLIDHGLEFDHQPKPYSGLSADEILQKRKTFLGPSLFYYYQKPINIVEGKMQYLFDENGKRYLDAFAGIVTVSCGHCHPDVVNAVVEQTKLLQHTTTIYLHHAIVEFAEALASKMPGNLKVVYFVNSGTEANELAMLMARLYSGNLGMIALRNAYHGGSAGTIGLTALNTWKYQIPQGENSPCYKSRPIPWSICSNADAYVRELKDHIDYGTPGKVAGFIAETFQSTERKLLQSNHRCVGGAVELAPGYLKSVYDVIHQAGGVCIADEVQSGFGRTGSHYWGFETQGVIPDIVTMAKGIGNGLPLGAVVTTPEIAQVMSQKIQFNTFGGTLCVLPVGSLWLKVLDKERRQSHCADVGSHLIERLRTLQQRHDLIGDVRGRGLMLGIELVTDKKEKTPAKLETAVLFEKLKGIYHLTSSHYLQSWRAGRKRGLHGNVFRIKPPMCFTKDDADFLVDALDYAISGI
ncbi:unnamed protein product [Spirodela intermedia]|uniref:alanine--glyoxylate transaminase n=1 Tax=Spirodela intermedia TaxID=51605 RepID=A0A7I8J6S4_SPIIN|nr:unnamed protein product [Spirodela intermedia]CAA6665103.1 unnamed protein product [Spirodela intermedia]